MSGVEARLERLEAMAAIQQLVARYALALDGRDATGWADLYVADVRVGPPVDGVGREALRRWFRAKCSYWYRSMHVIGAHQIDFDGPDRATGLAQCRVEQEIGDRWMTTAFLYRDEYRRDDGQWLFVHRHGQPIWCYSQHDDPLDGFERLPGGMPIRLPADYPAFREFWSDFTDEQVLSVTRRPVNPAPGRA
ncbi:MAG TPA: nuclear transport factor 2 family protein [Pseudonocardia sp.]